MCPEAKREGRISGQVGLEDMNQKCHTGGRTQVLPETPGHSALSVLMTASPIAITVIPVFQLWSCTSLKAWVTGKSLLGLRKTA